MQKLFMGLFDVLFPPSEDMLIVRNASSDTVLSLVREQNANGIISLSSYQNKIIRALVHEAKFHGSKKAFSILGALLDTYLEKHEHSFDLIIPIPLSSQRKRERGFNQVSEILFESQFKNQLNITERVLMRTKHTTPQTSLEKLERLENMKNVFRVYKPDHVKDKRILVVDDVTTTGATLRAAREELAKHSPASVTLLALAH